MQDIAHDADGLTLAAEAVYGFLRELQRAYALCAKHEGSAAIHERGNVLQVYRLFPREELTAKALHAASKELPGWECSPFWKAYGHEWAIPEKQVQNRLRRHGKQHPLLTRGVAWEGRPILIHAYKYEPDPVMKVELIVPEVPLPLPELPLYTIARALRCHEHLVPGCVAQALPPYDHHETRFSTLSEYLSCTMPPQLYNLPRFPLPTVETS